MCRRDSTSTSSIVNARVRRWDSGRMCRCGQKMYRQPAVRRMQVCNQYDAEIRVGSQRHGGNGAWRLPRGDSRCACLCCWQMFRVHMRRRRQRIRRLRQPTSGYQTDISFTVNSFQDTSINIKYRGTIKTHKVNSEKKCQKEGKKMH
jgi:hypothetical protein